MATSIGYLDCRDGKRHRRIRNIEYHSIGRGDLGLVAGKAAVPKRTCGDPVGHHAGKAAQLASTGRHPRLPEATMPVGARYTADLALACAGVEMVIFAVASAYVRDTARRARPFLTPEQILVTAAKGIEKQTLFTMTKVVADALAPMETQLAAISGHTHAEEVSRDMPTTMVCACADRSIAGRISQAFTSPVMRTYAATDVEGVELCGALKNIIALAAGCARGLGYGDNALAALITRGMAEIKRLGLAMGCRGETFDGLAGVGDLIVTCFSRHSRNMNAGLLVGGGMTPEAAIGEIGMVVEGVYALEAAGELAERYGVDMPIVRAVYDVFYRGTQPAAAAEALMLRNRT